MYQQLTNILKFANICVFISQFCGLSINLLKFKFLIHHVFYLIFTLTDSSQHFVNL